MALSTLEQELKVVVADDHALMRSGIMHALRQAEDIRVVGEAADGYGALAAVEEAQPDVLLLDFHMPRMDGLTCLDRLTVERPDLPVLILSVEDDPTIARQALARGAAGYVLKTIHPADLASMVRTAARRQVMFAGGLERGREDNPGTAATPEHRGDSQHVPAGDARATGNESDPTGPAAVLPPLKELSEREREILSLVCKGRTNKQIAAELYVTTKTVKFHLTNIFAKLGVANRTEACVLALRFQR